MKQSIESRVSGVFAGLRMFNCIQFGSSEKFGGKVRISPVKIVHFPLSEFEQVCSVNVIKIKNQGPLPRSGPEEPKKHIKKELRQSKAHLRYK